MAAPPSDPGTMTPQSKAALGARLGLDTPPSVLEGNGTTMAVSGVDQGAVDAAMGAAMSQDSAYQAEVHSVILASPAGSTATEGYHLDEQSAAINTHGAGPLEVGAVPDRPPQEHTTSPDS